MRLLKKSTDLEFDITSLEKVWLNNKIPKSYETFTEIIRKYFCGYFTMKETVPTQFIKIILLQNTIEGLPADQCIARRPWTMLKELKGMMLKVLKDILCLFLIHFSLTWMSGFDGHDCIQIPQIFMRIKLTIFCHI